ncbi:cytochrome c oxidase assembly protein COX19-like [Dreissena polymorpha]|uniref:Cytochrome c oxidase assembly protein COX19 n=1 Tax=Dreissena polymorpha TaxID=45954 RepID=A0A9D4M1B0_DREPO|nr:cytochrome c oxidase assembly protein COX19-like [Dreissena polymorpha]XP_052264897.1 cytochrome c oxidase assembly protein COX19-like [Dreissena polymorpha]KAH3867786.1 hypothetical protein DPMN_030923 [Dreissena polymorpha]
MATPAARFTPTPPDKGSFPIDHEGKCKVPMRRYMDCLRRKEYDNNLCRELSKEYLQCRMDNNLMQQEPWQKLGFKDLLTTETGDSR